jgi:hypothetical protein
MEIPLKRETLYVRSSLQRRFGDGPTQPGNIVFDPQPHYHLLHGFVILACCYPLLECEFDGWGHLVHYGVEEDVLTGAYRFPENGDLIALDVPAKAAFVKSVFSLELILFGKWLDLKRVYATHEETDVLPIH